MLESDLHLLLKYYISVVPRAEQVVIIFKEEDDYDNHYDDDGNDGGGDIGGEIDTSSLSDARLCHCDRQKERNLAGDSGLASASLFLIL